MSSRAPFTFSPNQKLVLLLVVVAVMVAAVFLRAPYANGSPFWPWTWRDLPALRWYPLMLAAAVPIVAAVLLPFSRRGMIVIALVLLSVGSVTMKLAQQLAQDESMTFKRMA